MKDMSIVDRGYGASIITVGFLLYVRLPRASGRIRVSSSEKEENTTRYDFPTHLPYSFLGNGLFVS